MPDSVMLSVRLPLDLSRRLEKLAEATERSRSYVAAKAIEQYVTSEEENLERIRQGLADAEQGRMVSDERADAWLADLARGKVRRPPQP